MCPSQRRERLATSTTPSSSSTQLLRSPVHSASERTAPATEQATTHPEVGGTVFVSASGAGMTRRLCTSGRLPACCAIPRPAQFYEASGIGLCWVWGPLWANSPPLPPVATRLFKFSCELRGAWPCGFDLMAHCIVCGANVGLDFVGKAEPCWKQAMTSPWKEHFKGSRPWGRCG